MPDYGDMAVTWMSAGGTNSVEQMHRDFAETALEDLADACIKRGT